MLGDVNAKIKDGLLGIIPDSGDGLHIKIGSATHHHGEILTITSTMDMDAIKTKLGDTPLFHSVMDSISMGCRMIHVIPVAASTDGSIGTLKKVMTGKGTLTAEGTPINRYDVTVIFIKSGGFNEATYSYSLDGGDNYSKETTVPSTGSLDLGIGVTLKLTEHTVKAESFISGDEISFKCNAPKMTNQDVLTAMQIVKNTKLPFEYLHIVGESKKPLWAAMSIEAQELFDQWKKPTAMLFEAVEIAEGQTLDTYVQSLLSERENIVSRDIQVVPTRVEFTAKDGKIRNTPLANLVCGLYARAKVHESIGKVEKFPLNGVLGILPAGIENYSEILDGAGYTTARQYLGLEGFYITNARSLALPTSDYIWMEHVRTMYKAIKRVRQQALTKMHMNIDPSEMKVEMLAFEKFLEIPLDAMEVDGEISAGKVTIDPNQNVLGTSSLKATVRIVPMGTLRNMELEFGFSNPYLQQGGKN